MTALLLLAFFARSLSAAGPEARVEVDAVRTGQFTHWELEGKRLVSPSEGLPLLRVECFPIEEGNPEPSATPLSGEFRLDARSVRHRRKKAGISLKGEISVAGTPVMAVACDYRLVDPHRPSVTLRLKPLEGLQRFRIRELHWQFPLSLEHRKRIYYPGENGLSWDTRYFYQFHTDTLGRLLPRPDRNEWRIFSLDQMSRNAFTLWRSEDETTHPLVMQYGRATPPFVQVYDEGGGVAMEYAGLRSLAPKALRVEAPGGGRLTVALWPASERPLDPRDKAGMATVCNVEHRVTLFGSVGEAAVEKVREKLTGRGSSQERLLPEKVFKEEEWLRAGGKASMLPHLVTGGYPLPRGLVREPGRLEVVADGKTVPTQSKAIGFWPDGSVKWALVSFLRDGSPEAERDEAGEDGPGAGPVVTYRHAEPVPVEVRIREGGGQGGAATGMGIATEETSDGVILNTGRLRVELARGERWIRSLRLGEKELLDFSRADRLAYADYWLAPLKVPPMASLPEGGKLAPGVLKVESLRLEETGPLRSVVRLEGRTTGREPMDVVLRVEVTAGSTALKLTHSAEILTQDPRKAWVRGLGLEIPLHLSSLARVRFGGGGEPVDVSPKAHRSWLHQRTPGLYEVGALKGAEPLRLASGGRAHGWVEVSGDEFGVVAAVRNFWQQSPNALEIDHRQPTLKIAFWPEQGPLMDLRRYSNHPHRSQGEGLPEVTSPDWVDRMYYRKEPVTGLSRTHEVLLEFHAEGVPDAERIAADFQSPPLLYAGWKHYQQSGVILPSAANWGRFWQNVDRFSAFWLWHRSLDQWYGFWNFGDIRHFFGTGYGWIFPPDVLRRHLADQKAGRPAKEERGKRVLDYAPPNDWAFDNGRWGWANTEGLPNLFFQHEYLRTGRRVLYFLSESMAQRSRDVVIRQSGRWFGKGTRHGVQPWSDGNHEERQTTHTEFKLHYFLSGDGRSRDVAKKLYEGFYSRADVAIHAAHSGRLYGLLTNWEMTGEPAQGETLKRYVAHFLSPDGLYVQPDVSFPGPVAAGPATELNGGSMFFHTFGGMHALLEYYYLTEDPGLRQSLIAMARHAIAEAKGKPPAWSYWAAIAFAARHAEDADPFRQALLQALSAERQLVYQTVSANPLFWSGDRAFLTGNAPRSFFWMTIAPYVVGVFENDPLWDEAIAREMKSLAETGIARRAGGASWQSEYDQVEGLEDYLGINRPWRLKSDVSPGSPPKHAVNR